MNTEALAEAITGILLPLGFVLILIVGLYRRGKHPKPIQKNLRWYLANSVVCQEAIWILFWVVAAATAAAFHL